MAPAAPAPAPLSTGQGGPPGCRALGWVRGRVWETPGVTLWAALWDAPGDARWDTPSSSFIPSGLS